MNASAPQSAEESQKIVQPAKPVATERLQYAALPWRGPERHRNPARHLAQHAALDHSQGLADGRTHELPPACAALEALEEAGLLGVISKKPIGSYFYEKRFSRYAQTCRVEVFPLRVVRQRNDWPEKHERSTKWFPADEAKDLVAEPELALVDRQVHPLFQSVIFPQRRKARDLRAGTRLCISSAQPK